MAFFTWCLRRLHTEIGHKIPVGVKCMFCGYKETVWFRIHSTNVHWSRSCGRSCAGFWGWSSEPDRPGLCPLGACSEWGRWTLTNYNTLSSYLKWDEFYNKRSARGNGKVWWRQTLIQGACESGHWGRWSSDKSKEWVEWALQECPEGKRAPDRVVSAGHGRKLVF